MNIHFKFGEVVTPPPVDPPPPTPAPSPIRTITVPNDGARYMRLVDDWETEKWGFMARSKALGYKREPPWNALPATIPMRNSPDFMALSEAWQRF